MFCFVGRLTIDKGIKELFTAFDRLNKEISNTALILVGKPELDLDSSLKSFLENKSVILVGEKPSKDIKKYISASDVLVHPTHREGFGMVLQEAGAMQTAIITTDIPGAGEVFENGKSCLLVPAKDDENLYLAMKRLCLDFDLRDKLAVEARKKTEETYDRSIMLKYQHDFYTELGV